MTNEERIAALEEEVRMMRDAIIAITTGGTIHLDHLGRVVGIPIAPPREGARIGFSQFRTL